MKSFAYEVVVTEELLRSALPQICEATRIAVRMRQRQSQWILVAIFCACAVVGLVVNAALAQGAAPTDRKFYAGLAVISLGVAIGLPFAFWFVDYVKHRYSWWQFPDRFADRLNTRTATRVVQQLIAQTPFTARYEFSEQDVVTTIVSLNLRRRRCFAQIQMVFVGDRFLAVWYRRFLFPLVFYFTETLEQHQQLESHLRACNLEVASLPPKFVPQTEKEPL